MQAQEISDKRPAVINFERAKQRERLRRRLLEMILRNQAQLKARPR